jgi:hypothetical protein
MRRIPEESLLLTRRHEKLKPHCFCYVTSGDDKGINTEIKRNCTQRMSGIKQLVCKIFLYLITVFKAEKVNLTFLKEVTLVF